jgi:arginine exporter protein ArgO
MGYFNFVFGIAMVILFAFLLKQALKKQPSFKALLVTLFPDVMLVLAAGVYLVLSSIF